VFFSPFFFGRTRSDSNAIYRPLASHRETGAEVIQTRTQSTHAHTLTKKKNKRKTAKLNRRPAPPDRIAADRKRRSRLRLRLRIRFPKRKKKRRQRSLSIAIGWRTNLYSSRPIFSTPIGRVSRCAWRFQWLEQKVSHFPICWGPRIVCWLPLR